MEFVQTKRNSSKIIVSANRAHDTQWHGANIWSNCFINCTFFCFLAGIIQRKQKRKKKNFGYPNHFAIAHFFWWIYFNCESTTDALTSQYSIFWSYRVIIILFMRYIFRIAYLAMVEKFGRKLVGKKEIIWCGARLRVNHLNRNLDCVTFFASANGECGGLRKVFHWSVCILFMNRRSLVQIVHQYYYEYNVQYTYNCRMKIIE